ncbi:Actin cytoskeleton-regulatory complex protein SLA1 [Smittium culicis]|uniref:Actin cytoskeleton-regulatory complex protein SLA1 n=1 Tax=Smittium culicis TaxID=133412 RepID=A0A1R1YRK6_9FUNG|nr:Actin cytoskeleton-regulatory complex protein SLA1 [Smittium culicis]
MPFSKVCRAIYEYSAQDEEELTFHEDQLFFFIEEAEPGWVRVKARDPVDSSSSFGIVPATYLEEAVSIYDYVHTDEEETSISEDEYVQVLDDEDPDWILIKSKAGVGFVPKSYLEVSNNKIISSIQTEHHTPDSALDVPKSSDLSPTTSYTASDPLQTKDTNNDVQIPPPLPPKDDDKKNNTVSNIKHTNQPSSLLNSTKEANQPSYNNSDFTSKSIYATALYNYDSSNSDEISIKKGQNVQIIESHLNGWCFVSSVQNGRESTGLVPLDYLEIVESASTSMPITKPTSNVPSNPINLNSSISPTSSIPFKSKNQIPSLPTPLTNSIHSNKTKSITKDNKPSFGFESSSNKNRVLITDPDKPIEDLRIWTDLTGTFTIEARFLYLGDNKLAFLVKKNGVEVQIPFEKLSSKDQEFINKQLSVKSAQPPDFTSTRPWKLRNNHDFDWFDFLTLKSGINADKSLRYDTSFTAEGLDEQSISELLNEPDNSTLKSLGVNDNDIGTIIQSFKKHLNISTDISSTNDLKNSIRIDQKSTVKSSNFANKPTTNLKPQALKSQINIQSYSSKSFSKYSDDNKLANSNDDAWDPKSKLKPVLGSKIYSDPSSNTNIVSTTNKAPFSNTTTNTVSLSQNPINQTLNSSQSSSYLDSLAKKKALELAEQEKRLALQQQELKNASLLLQQQQNHLMQLQQTQQVEQQLLKIKEQREKQEAENQRKNILSQKSLLEQQRKQLEDMKNAINQNNNLFKQQQNTFSNQQQFSNNPNTNGPSNLANPSKLIPPLTAAKPQQPLQPQVITSNQVKSAFVPSSFNQFSTASASNNPSPSSFSTISAGKYDVFSKVNPSSASVFSQNSNTLNSFNLQNNPSTFSNNVMNSNQFQNNQQNVSTNLPSNHKISSTPNSFQSSQIPSVVQSNQFLQNQVIANPQLISRAQPNQYFSQFNNSASGYVSSSPSTFSNQTSILQSSQLLNNQTHNAQLQNSQLQNAQLQNAQLQNAQLQNAQLQNAQLQNAQLQNTQLQNNQLQNIQLQNPQLQNSQIQNPQMQNSQFNNQMQNNQFNNQLQNSQIQNAQLLNSVGVNNQSPTQFQQSSIQTSGQIQYQFPTQQFGTNSSNSVPQNGVPVYTAVNPGSFQNQVNYQPQQQGVYSQNLPYQQNVVGFNPSVLALQSQNQNQQQYNYYNNQQQR